MEQKSYLMPIILKRKEGQDIHGTGVENTHRNTHKKIDQTSYVTFHQIKKSGGI
jgi:hypothetical protein